ncbi:MAG: tetratricopeptide repeat protein, partial [Dokdonella sp.]
NPDGWALLGRAYQSTGQFAESRDALKRAYELSPDNHDLTVEYAQASALAGEGRLIIGEPRVLLERVLTADPNHQRALWLVGISDYQQANYAGAISAWNRLLPNLPADSDIAKSVRTQIAEAERLAGGAPSALTPAAPAPANTSTAPIAPTAQAHDGARLSIRVSLDPALQSKLQDGDTLFVFARAASGPPMPLAIQRIPASGLPLTVTLDDSMGMLPSMKLSMFPQVIVGARISKSGNAIAQSGDLQKLTQAIEVSRTDAIDVVIDSVVP